MADMARRLAIRYVDVCTHTPLGGTHERYLTEAAASTRERRIDTLSQGVEINVASMLGGGVRIAVSSPLHLECLALYRAVDSL